jgi:hypothetical protein
MGDSLQPHASHTTPMHSPLQDNTEADVISALFTGAVAARAAITELRDIGIASADISLIMRGQDHSHDSSMGSIDGAAVESSDPDVATYRASKELPNDEDLPTTQAAMTGRDLPVVTDFEVPPDEPLGGSTRLGLASQDDMVRRMEADSNADADIYTDFPDEPAGINPSSPTAGQARALHEQDLREQATMEAPTTGAAAVGAGLGGVAGLLVGLASLAIPGVGPFIAAGPLAAALGGVVAGGVAGGVIGALSTAGVPEEYARTYAAAIENGETLVSVRVNDLTHDPVERVLTAHGGREIH